MTIHFPRLSVALLAIAFTLSGVGCFPAYPPPDDRFAYQDSKGYAVPQEPAPYRQPPRQAGVDPALVVAGAAAAGLVGYAIGNNRGYRHHYDGPRYYAPARYGRNYDYQQYR